MDMIDRNTVIVDRSPPVADLRLENTTTSRSPQTQKCNIQEINENIGQTHKIYQIQNCGTVYMESCNACGVKMENCGNNAPQVTYHHPGIIGNEKVLQSQPHKVSNGTQNAMGPPTAPTAPTGEIAKSNSSNVHLQTNTLSPLQCPQPISPSHISGDHTHHNIKYLEQLLDSSLATAAVIQFSGNTLADVLTPRAYDTIKALYALAALDAPECTKYRGGKIPTRPTSSDIGNDCPYSSSRSSSLPNSSLAVPRTGKINISISVD